MSGPAWRARLRGEVLCFPLDDGGAELYDLIRSRLLVLDRSEVARLDQGDAPAVERLAKAGVFEGPDADALRHETWLTRRAERQRVDTATTDDAGVRAMDWRIAQDLPALVASAWRDPERWRRLAQARLAGRRYLTLPGFVGSEDAAMLSQAVAELPFDRLETTLLQADRLLLRPGTLDAWRALLLSPVARRLFGAVVGRELPPAITANAWRLQPGDFFGPHPDGRRYHGTISLGLCHDWNASDGGAIAFGTPRQDAGFDVTERWLPHAGDLCVFAPDADTWHVVERVAETASQRLTITAWWVDPVDAV